MKKKKKSKKKKKKKGKRKAGYHLIIFETNSNYQWKEIKRKRVEGRKKWDEESVGAFELAKSPGR
jgi:hypothetical protein